VGEFAGNGCLVPEGRDVANALGAVVGQVRVSIEAQVSQPREGVLRVSSPQGIRDFGEEDAALAEAERAAREVLAARAAEAGAESVEITVDRDVRAATVEGQRSCIEAVLTATATGRPRIGR